MANSSDSTDNSQTSHPHRVYMLCPGETVCSKAEIFSGWVDTNLTDKGFREAHNAGKLLKDWGIRFDSAYTSVLQSSRQTCYELLNSMNNRCINICESCHLNSRHVGALTGLSKIDAFKKWGKEQVTSWCRSYVVPPPSLRKSHPFYDIITNDKRYKKELNEIPSCESVKMTEERVLKYFCDKILPDIKDGKNVIIVAHASVLRTIIRRCENYSDTEIKIPTGVPFYYDIDIDSIPQGAVINLSGKTAVKKTNQA